MEKRVMEPFFKPVCARVTVPGSKSMTNRALVLAALAEGTSELTGVLDSEDTRIMLAALEKLGVVLRQDWATHTVSVEGCGGLFPERQAEIYVGNSGTTARFLTAVLAGCPGRFRLDGKLRMRERPVSSLLTALETLGAKFVCEDKPGCFPLTIHGSSRLAGKANVFGAASSQFLSGLLMASVMSTDDIELKIEGELVSRPYIEMTLAMMKSFGVDVEFDDSFRRFRVPAGEHYVPQRYAIEPDASAASYFFAIPAIVGGRVTVTGLSKKSLQGDVQFVDCLAAMNCVVREENDEITVERLPGGVSACEHELAHAPVDSILPLETQLRGASDTSDSVKDRSEDQKRAVGLKKPRSGSASFFTPLPLVAAEPKIPPLFGIDVDMNDISDTVQTLAIVAMFAATPTRIRNVAHIRRKETDRIKAVVTELRRFGVSVREFEDGLEIWGSSKNIFHGASIQTYDDHRMAMSFSLAGLKIPGVVIENPQCVEKTYPQFFEDLEKTRPVQCPETT